MFCKRFSRITLSSRAICLISFNWNHNWTKFFLLHKNLLTIQEKKSAILKLLTVKFTVTIFAKNQYSTDCKYRWCYSVFILYIENFMFIGLILPSIALLARYAMMIRQKKFLYFNKICFLWIYLSIRCENRYQRSKQKLKFRYHLNK